MIENYTKKVNKNVLKKLERIKKIKIPKKYILSDLYEQYELQIKEEPVYQKKKS